MTLTTLVPNFTDLSRFQFLRAFQVVLLEWNRFTGFLGRLIGHLPFVPDLPSWLVNAMLFSMSICVPAAYGFFARSTISNVDVAAIRSIPQRLVDRPVGLQGLRNALGPAYPLFAESLYFVLAIFVIPFVVFSPFDIVYADDTLFPVWIYKIAIGFWVLATVFFIVVGVFSIPRFAKALFVTISFLVTLELLYVANTPTLSTWIDRYYCENVDPGDDDCAKHGSSG